MFIHWEDNLSARSISGSQKVLFQKKKSVISLLPLNLAAWREGEQEERSGVDGPTLLCVNRLLS